LLALRTILAIEIADHLAATSKWPMDDLCSLRATCSFMRRICGDPAIGRRVATDRCRCGVRSWNDLDNYYVLLASLTQLGNLEACFLTGVPMVFTDNQRPRPCLDDLSRTTDGGHNVVAYLVTILLYRRNDGAGDDDTARRYIRRVEGKEES
jgi:hypothetical protein